MEVLGMNTKISAKNTIITPGISNRIFKKTEKMYRYLYPDTEISVHISKDNGKRKKVEITVPMKGTILRAESISDDNLFIAIDSALSKIERQIHKHKDKLGDRIRQESVMPNDYEFIEDVDLDEKKEIKRRKLYPVRPMSLEDAILQMELLGHSFYIYVDSDTNNTNVLYLRKDGSLGLLEPEN